MNILLFSQHFIRKIIYVRFELCVQRLVLLLGFGVRAPECHNPALGLGPPGSPYPALQSAPCSCIKSARLMNTALISSLITFYSFTNCGNLYSASSISLLRGALVTCSHSLSLILLMYSWNSLPLEIRTYYHRKLRKHCQLILRCTWFRSDRKPCYNAFVKVFKRATYRKCSHAYIYTHIPLNSRKWLAWSAAICSSMLGQFFRS